MIIFSLSNILILILSDIFTEHRHQSGLSFFKKKKYIYFDLFNCVKLSFNTLQRSSVKLNNLY